MKWADYYKRYDEWQESTQYSRLASITDFGPEGSPSAEIADCIQYVESRTAASIIRRALAAGVRFRTTEITDIVDSGQIEDEGLLSKLICAYSGTHTGEQLETLLSCFSDLEPVEKLIAQICAKSTHFTEKDILTLLPYMPDDGAMNKLVGSTDARFSEDGLNELYDYGVEESLIKNISKRSGIPYADPADPMEEPPDDSPDQKPGFLSTLLAGFALFGGSKTKHTGNCTGDCAHCPPHYGYRYSRWYYGHGHTDGCEFCGNGGCNGKCHID